jgi:squalene-associated FAD-dependent desaturase
MNVGIVGAGLAGLAAGCELAGHGHRVTLFEKRPFAGGKTYSFTDSETGDVTDNGQHVFMRCTTEYTAFLRKLGTLHLARRQNRLKAPVFGPQGRRSVIAAAPLPAPFHLLPSFVAYKHLGVRSKLRVGRLLAAVHRMREDERLGLWEVSFDAWLRDHGQRDEEISRFWDFLLLPTLNARSREVAARDALFVVREGFLASSKSAAIGLAKDGLDTLHVAPAIGYIEARGGTVELSSDVRGMDADGNRAAVVIADGTRREFDAVVCATGHRQALNLLPSSVTEDPAFGALALMESAPIINLHCWFDRPVASFSMAAFVDSELQWVFNRSRLSGERDAGREQLVVSLSGAQRYMAMDKGELERHFIPILRKALPGSAQAELIRFVAIKEPEATFVPAPGLRRPPNSTRIVNLVVAGAYTATGWPATMESAVRSGNAAARAINVLCQGARK